MRARQSSVRRRQEPHGALITNWSHEG